MIVFQRSEADECDFAVHPCEVCPKNKKRLCTLADNLLLKTSWGGFRCAQYIHWDILRHFDMGKASGYEDGYLTAIKELSGRSADAEYIQHLLSLNR